jgi:tRNA-dihydrouridine synthase A
MPTLMNPREIRFSVAPMMDWTDRHCRSFHRLLSRRARLYTEMVHAGAVIHGNREQIIGHDAGEHPLAVQLGGSDPAQLSQAARICTEAGFVEINLNCGCPSDRVQGGNFGACLMREPELVAEGISAMKAVTTVPITVKCRIGVDEQNAEEALFTFAETVIGAGCDHLIVHARKAWLQGLSPKENREIPPLDYDLVHRLKAAYPAYPIAINGGLQAIEDCKRELAIMDGVMVGRAAYQSPEMLLSVDPELFGEVASFPDIFAALEAFRPYLQQKLADGVRLHSMTKHLLGLFPGRPGARLFRRHLSMATLAPGAGIEVFDAAIQIIKDAALRQTEEHAA